MSSERAAKLAREIHTLCYRKMGADHANIYECPTCNEIKAVFEPELSRLQQENERLTGMNQDVYELGRSSALQDCAAEMNKMREELKALQLEMGEAARALGQVAGPITNRIRVFKQEYSDEIARLDGELKALREQMRRLILDGRWDEANDNGDIELLFSAAEWDAIERALGPVPEGGR